jgi:hypothetical protein
MTSRQCEQLKGGSPLSARATMSANSIAHFFVHEDTSLD